MPEIIPVKTELAGELKQFRKGDFSPVKFGGTGTSLFNNNKPARNYKGIIVGNATNPLQLLKCIYDGTRDPNYLDSHKRGYARGSRWINIDKNTEWLCVDAKSINDGAVWIQSGSGSGGTVDDTFRYYASLVDFVYDYQNYSWADINSNFKKEVFQIDYYYGGALGTHVARMNITYNSDNQPINITMNYLFPSRPDKTLNFAYDDDGYFDTMDRT